MDISANGRQPPAARVRRIRSGDETQAGFEHFTGKMRSVAIPGDLAQLGCAELPARHALLELGELACELARKLTDERGLCIQQDDPGTEATSLIEQRDVFGQSAEQST